MKSFAILRIAILYLILLGATAAPTPIDKPSGIPLARSTSTSASTSTDVLLPQSTSADASISADDIGKPCGRGCASCASRPNITTREEFKSNKRSLSNPWQWPWNGDVHDYLRDELSTSLWVELVNSLGGTLSVAVFLHLTVQ